MAFSFGTPAAPAAGTSGTSGFSFGATPAQQQQQQNKPATGGFSFGTPAATSQPAAPSAAPATTGGGLFGGFGSSQTGAASAAPSAQAPAASSTGGLFSFGAKPATSQPQQQATSTFGSGSGTTGGGGLFGSSNTNTQPASSGTGFSFGAPANSQQQQQQPAQPSTTSLFGAPASSFATSSAQQPVAQTQFSQQNQQQQQLTPAQPDKKLGAPLSSKLEQIRAAWDTNNAAACRFVYYFYNNAGNASNLKHIQGRRPDAVGAMHDQLWAAAIRENPDPNRLYPVLALGFNDLKKRIESQAREAQRQRALLANLATRLAALEQKHSLSNSVRAQAAQSRQAQLHQRLIGLVAKTQLLVPALRGKSVGPEEERLIAILEACEAEITGSNAAVGSRSVVLTNANGAAGAGAAGLHAAAAHPANHARLRARINELWAQLGVVRAKREMLAREGRSATTEWAVVDPSGLENVTRILAQQQQGLNHLSTTLEHDSKAMDTITSGLTGVKLVGVSR